MHVHWMCVYVRAFHTTYHPLTLLARHISVSHQGKQIGMNRDLLMLLHKLGILAVYTRKARWNVTEG